MAITLQTKTNKLLDLLTDLRSIPFERWPKSITFRAASASSDGTLNSAKISFQGSQYYIYYHHKESSYIVEHD